MGRIERIEQSPISLGDRIGNYLFLAVYIVAVLGFLDGVPDGKVNAFGLIR